MTAPVPGPHRPSWIELSVALTALVVSVGSLLVARHQAQVMDRQLAATVWPLLEYETSNLGDDGRPRLSLALRNSGVGPTRVRSVRVAYQGRAVGDAGDLLRACCTAAIDTTREVNSVTSDVRGRVIAAGRHIDFLVLPPDSAQRALFRAFNRARFDVDVRVCYCSVLDECWVRTSEDDEPAPVASCAAEAKAPQYR